MVINKYLSRVFLTACFLSSAILEELKATSAYRGKKDNEMVIPICSRSGDVIEPRMTPQVQCLHGAARMCLCIHDCSRLESCRPSAVH